MTDAEGHLNLANATQTEQSHLATTQQQIEEYALSIKTHEAKIVSYQDGIAAERDAIRNDRFEQAKLKRKRRIFKTAVFQLEMVDAE